MNGSTRPPRRLLVIANPISGGGRGRSAAPALAAELARAGVTAEVHFTTRAGDATTRAAAAAGEDWDGVVAVGGDGTVNEVLNGLQGGRKTLGVLPMGTANVLAIELRLPSKPAAAAAVIAAGHRRSLAVGVCNGRRFLLFVGAGIDGAVVHRLAEVRTGTLGKHKWLGPILHTVRRWPRFSLTATLSDGTRRENLASILVTRVRNFGGLFHLTPDVDPFDGKLHVLCFRTRSRLRWAWLGTRALFGRLRPGPWLECFTTDRVQIDGVAPFQIDGDAGGASPADIRLCEEPIAVFAPQER